MDVHDSIGVCTEGKIEQVEGEKQRKIWKMIEPQAVGVSCDTPTLGAFGIQPRKQGVVKAGDVLR